MKKGVCILLLLIRNLRPILSAMLLFPVFQVFAQPAITSFTPANGPVGTLVTIAGTNLSSPTGVSIGGMSAITISNTGSSLVAMVMPNAVTGAISVTTAGGTANSSINFTVTATPYPSVQQGNKLLGNDYVTNSGQFVTNQICSVSISADGSTAIVGNFTQDAAWIFIRSNGVWSQQGPKLVGSGSVGTSQQGTSVSISADGNTALVGGPKDNNNIGATWVFTRSGTTWTQQGTKLIGSGYTGNDIEQGSSVSITADGNAAVISGPVDNNYHGAIWIFSKTAGSWSQNGSKLVITGSGNTFPIFGYSVALSSDGRTLVAGSPYDNDSKGGAWVFTNNGGTWVQQGNELIASDYQGEAYQGHSVSISADGNTIMVGANADNNYIGAAWIYTRTGSSWSQQGSKLVGGGYSGSEIHQGQSVSLSADGNIAIIGGAYDNNGIGALWVYKRFGGIWFQQNSKLVASGNSQFALMGVSVCLSANGETVISGDNGSSSFLGGAFVFTKLSSSNANLSNLTISSGTLSPVFASATTSYTVSVSSATTSVTVTPTTSDATATVTINGIAVASGSASGGISLNVGSNVISTVVTAQDGTTIKTYTIAVTRAAPPPTITSFTPSTGPVGTLVTISGSNLGSPTGLTIGGLSAITISNTGSSLMAMVMPGATTGGVSVTTSGGTVNSSSNFTVTATPYPSAQQGGKLVGTGNAGQGNQGISVALSADGNTAVWGGDIDNNIQGAAWVYVRSGSTWTSQAKLVATDNTLAVLGATISISADGNTVLVGGPNDNQSQGAAWVFTRNGTFWSQQAKLVGTGNVGAASQGNAVGLSADGNTAIVGGWNDNGNQGAAWIYTRTGTTWTQVGNKLVGTGNTGAAQQGIYVAISSDGNTAMVGGSSDNSSQGAIWVYTRSGSAWSQQGNKLTGSGSAGAGTLGYSIALSADGNTAMAGGPGDNGGIGAMWVFTRSGSTWSQQGNKIVASDAVGASSFGITASLSADGNTAMTGGYLDNSNVGAAWVFTRTGSTWTQRGTKLVGTGTTGVANQGRSVYVSSDGSTGIVGGYGDNSQIGAAWIYIVDHTPPTPTITATGSTSFCVGGSVLLTSSAATGNQWYNDGTLITSATGQTYSATASGNYTVLVTVSGYSSAASAAITVTVNAAPATPIITASGPTTFCQGGSVILSTPVTYKNTWTQKAGFGGNPRYGAAGFSIGTRGYIGTGRDYNTGSTFYNDFWEYDPSTNAWTQKANFAGTPRGYTSSFSIGNKGYIGTGYDGSSLKNDFWEYDPSTNAWTQKANFGGTARESAIGLSIGTKGYIGTGYDGIYRNDFWEYDPVANTWTQKAIFGGTGRYLATGFSIGSKGYIGTGYTNGLGLNDFLEYDPTANAWTQKADFGDTARYYAVGISIGSKGYIGLGYDNNTGSPTNDFWEYDATTNAWTQKAAFGGPGTELASGFSIGTKGYIGTGVSVPRNNDFWEYDASAVITFTWSPGGATTPSITASSSGNYSVTATNQSGCSATSAIVNVIATTNNTWTGAISTAWEDASNWSCGSVPTYMTDVYVNSGVPRYPVVQSIATCKSLHQAPATSLTVVTGFKIIVSTGN